MRLGSPDEPATGPRKGRSKARESTLKKFWALLAIALLAMGLVAGCSDDDDPAGPGDDNTLTPLEEFTAVVDVGLGYLATTGAPNVKDYAWFSSQTNGFDGFTILDIRSASDYAAGHIEDAINTSLGAMLGAIDAGTIPVDRPFMVVCYTGQSAGHAVAALNMLGYVAYSYKFGMAAWHTSLDTAWENNAGPTNGTAMADAGVAIETTVNTPTVTYEWPNLGLPVESPAEAVSARVAATLTAGFKAKNLATIHADGLEDYFIVKYWTMDQYTGADPATPGHIPGAYCFVPKVDLDVDFETEGLLEYLPTDKPIIVYCWTGQTSSQVAFVLNCLGYEAYSLSFGANNLFWSELGANQWVDNAPEHPLVSK
ncbi:hypothetical protein FJ251_11520 [bacterium]|nr:hypothetical protein [bacterium]